MQVSDHQRHREGSWSCLQKTCNVKYVCRQFFFIKKSVKEGRRQWKARVTMIISSFTLCQRQKFASDKKNCFQTRDDHHGSSRSYMSSWGNIQADINSIMSTVVHSSSFTALVKLKRRTTLWHHEEEKNYNLTPSWRLDDPSMYNNNRHLLQSWFFSFRRVIRRRKFPSINFCFLMGLGNELLYKT